MSNNINWGKIYESTAWGSGVDNNTIGWGDSYADLAGGGPKNTIAPVISGTAERGETLTSTTGTWTGTGTITYAYQWKRNGADISGATSSTYVLVAADDNANMTCVVSATDTEGTKSATSNTLGPVLAAPLNLTSPVASGTAQVGQTLSTTDGTWQGIATITFAYQWRRDAVNISGATSSTYTLVAADYTTDVDCVVTATNGLGSASADSNDILNIAGTAPSISGVPTLSGTAKVDSTLTATAASVSGVPTPTTTFQWQRSDNGTSGWANISGATSSTYTLVLADDTNYVRAVQTETNAVGTDSANSAASSQISSTPAYDYLLDDYSGASAAYSLRLLDSTYSGNAIKVRRASDNAEQDIAFVNNELDTASLETFASGTDAFVTTWYDQSGSGNDATQTTASAQPQIVSSGSTILENGKASIQNANLKHLESPTTDGLYSTKTNVFATMSIDTDLSSNNQRIIHLSNGSNSMQITRGNSGNSYSIIIKNSDYDASFDSTSYGQFSNQHLFNFLGDNTANATTLFIDGTSKTDLGSIGTGGGNNSKNTFGVRNDVLASSYFSGKFQEIVIYDSDQSSNRTGIETNINDFYSIY